MSTESFVPVIESLLDTDLYKFTMWQAMLHRHPEARAEYRFINRERPEHPLAELAPEIERQLDHLCTLRFLPEELDYLRGLRYIKSDFVDFLSLFHFQRHFIQVSTQDGTLQIVARGPQVHVMAFEIFVLAIVNEIYFRRHQTPDVLAEGRRRLRDKIALLRAFDREPARRFPLLISDFGLRRRFSRAWQAEVVSTLRQAAPRHLTGTSNVALARALDLVPVGTMAHEYLQSYQAFGKVRLRDFQRAALEDWVQEYRGDLGIALTDVVGMDAFLADFDLYFAKLFDGLRHDSGDPFVWGERAIAHYRTLRIDPAGKRFVFSDGLDLPRALELYRHFADRVQPAFGIGTNLTNDLGPRPLNIVMKLFECNGMPTAKLPDSPGKVHCTDETFLAYLRQVFGRAG
ncbi:nicotinate phosphoribosyltransferase [Castellaniella denitrificans]|uniref:Nicotinate phosphoribosyltransferase n=1 Tax=Castellaniella denitrificans TaxID=56119 RepID=A0ABT4M8A4_9BURK|nr:nicotinate phosphoribosyltransferase [Castellaniella denitrificans]MCZ4330705.1 nicotinate phosphoribosyltransferase [Castellaniella denitrificans]